MIAFFQSLSKTRAKNPHQRMNIVNDKLEQYLLLAKGLRGLGLSDLIKKIIEEPGIFTFGELLLLPQVQQVMIYMFITSAYDERMPFRHSFVYPSPLFFHRPSVHINFFLAAAHRPQCFLFPLAALCIRHPLRLPLFSIKIRPPFRNAAQKTSNSHRRHDGRLPSHASLRRPPKRA